MADAYTHYVMNLGISEELFWDADIWFVEAVAANRAAYDLWRTNAISAG